MTKQKRLAFVSVMMAALLALVLVFGAAAQGMSDAQTEKEGVTVNLASDSTDKVDIVTESGSEYALIYAGDSTFATQFANVLYVPAGTRPIRAALDKNTEETEKEILIGSTDRAFSQMLLAELNKLGDETEVYAWGYAYSGGKLAYVANCKTAFALGQDAFLALVDSEGFLSVPSDLYVIDSITVKEYEDQLRAEEEAKRQEKIDALVEMNNAFTDGQFNTDKYTPGKFYESMPPSSKGAPWAYPTPNVHPRYLLTENNIERIREILKEGEDKNSDYYHLAQEFWKRANTDMESIHYGVFQDQYKSTGGNSWLEPTGESYRYNGTTLGVIDAKAMAYLVTGDEIYAYEAIVAIKNAMLSLKYTTDLHMDVYHGPSHVMVTLAAVYDWCYDVLTETDKWQMIWGTAQVLGPQMESGMRYPPSGMNGVNGHGTGPQLSRDWMTVATVFYDEAPDWWEFVAGRYFNEYLPVANYQFESGWVSQGTACYAPIKVHVQAWAAYLIYLSTGVNFLTEDANQTMYFFQSHYTPRDTGNPHQKYYFQTGDGSRSPGGTQSGNAEYFVIAALYNDPYVYAMAKELTANHSKFNYDTIFTMTPAFQLAFTSAVDYNGEGPRDNSTAIQYFAYPASQMTIREEWDNPDSIAVLMRLMNLTMANHEGYDHGTFQIYYKGLLAGTSGAYQKYGSAAHYYYQQATISSNGLLVFNPALASTNPNDTAKYMYSGSQVRKVISTSSADAWVNSGLMVETIGADYGYNSDGTPKYAYLAGDLSPAYDPTTVEYIGRHMLTIFTKDEDFPAIFLTYDQITSVDETFRKTWLLHTLKEPEIDIDDLSATVINGEGKMYLRSLYGADSIVKIGGEGKAWWINGYFTDPGNRGSWDERTQSFTDETNKGSWVEGKNALDGYATDDNAKNIWGRIELRAEGEKPTNFLTLLAVTDTANEAEFEYTKFSSDTTHGVQVGNNVIAFANTTAKYYKEFSFTTTGNGLYEYYVANVEAGTWQVIVDGVSVAYSLAEEEGGMLTFVAPTGNVELKPGKDVIGANGGRIQYNTGGAVLPKDAPYTYRNETATPLPTELVRGEDKFVAWYTSPNYEPETLITEIPQGATGTIKVYAKWISNFLNEDYSTTVVKLNEGSAGIGGVNYNGNTKTGSSFTTKYDEVLGRNYLEWIEGTLDPIINQTSSSKNFSMLGSDDKCVSFTYSLALEPGMTPMQTHVRLIAKKDVNGGTISSTATYLFTTDTNGNVKTNDGGTLCTLKEGEVTDIRVVIDFKNGQMRYYDEDYNLVATDNWTPPKTTGTTSTEEFLKCLTEYLWYFYGGSPASVTDAALRVYGIRVQEGDEFTGLAKPQTEGIKYNAGGAVLPDDAPKDFNADGSLTLLPTGLKMNGYVFDGWYTTPTFDEGTETTFAPAGTTGLYEVWAKWNAIFKDEDWSDKDIDHAESNKSYNGLNYNSKDKPQSSYKTEVTDGVKYLVWTPGTADPLINFSDNNSNVSTMTDTSISYTITVGKHGDAGIPNFEFRLIGKHTVDGETGKGDSNIYIGKINGGKFLLGSSSIAIADLTAGEPVTVRIVLDFAAGNIVAYDEWGSQIASTPMPSIPAASGATSTLEWMKCFRSYLFYTRRTASAGDPTEAIRYYKLRIEEGNAFETEAEPPKPNSIIYEANGGKLPENAPTEYDVSLGTLLPTDVTREGYIFGGWYTDAAFKGERIDYIPFGSLNPVKVYAKWLYIPLEETWDDQDFVHSESTNINRDGLIYNTGGASELKPGTGFETVKDENGNVYLKAYSPSFTTFLVANNSGKYQFPEFKETAMTYEISYGRDGDIPLATNNVRLQTAGGNYGQYNLFRIEGSTGEATLNGGAAPFAVVGDEMVKFRIVVDFAECTITAYGESGEILDRVNLGAVPTSKAGNYQPTTWVEWMKYATGYYVYNQLGGPAGFTAQEGTVWGARFDDFRIIDGNAYVDFATELPKSTSIKYETSGGILPAGAPEEYDPAQDTELPKPTKKDFAFAGWYTTKNFEEGTRVEKIAAGTDGMITLYAKWTYEFVNESFESKDLDASASTTYGKVGLNLQKEGSVASTVLDAQGNKYLKVSATKEDAIVMITNSSYNLTTMNETQLSIQLDLLPSEDITSNLQINIATSGSAYGQLRLGSLNGTTGSFKLVGSSVEVANVSTGRVTLRLLVDFAAEKVFAYDAEGNLIDSAVLTVPTSKEGNEQPTTLLRWQELASNYLFYGWMDNPQKKTDGTTSSLGFDNITVAEGCIFTVKPAAPEVETPEGDTSTEEA